MTDLEAELQRLKERHEAMQQNLARQQRVLDEILRRASALAEEPPSTGANKPPAIPAVAPVPSGPAAPVPAEVEPPRLAAEPSAGPAPNATRPFKLGGHISAAGRRAGRSAAFPGNSVRFDEVRLEVGGAIGPRVLAWADLEALTRERYKRGMQVGEMFLEVALLRERPDVRLRLGRLDVPFGREHRRRDAPDNPLVSHSVADVRGVDEGVQLQGGRGRWDWALALQNGLRRPATNLLAVRSGALRLGFSPSPNLRLGGSILRTGRLPQTEGNGGPLWVGNAPLRRLPGSAAGSIRVRGLAGDAEFSWRGGRLAAEIGVIAYEDDDPRRAIRREMPFLSVEAVQQLGPKTYLAGRYSGIGTASGFLLPGEGRTDDARLTERLERFSFGVGYGPRPSLTLKLEQSFNLGRRVGGTERTGENQTAAEAVLRF